MNFLTSAEHAQFHRWIRLPVEFRIDFCMISTEAETKLASLYTSDNINNNRNDFNDEENNII